MSLSADSSAQLAVYAQLGVGFAGFAGVIGAYSRFRIHVEATVFRVRPWSRSPSWRCCSPCCRT
jgi:hypothetical protein